MVVVAIYFLVTVLIIASSITVKFKIEQENSILITFLTSILMMYVLGLLNIMKISLYLIIILDILGMIYLIYKAIKKEVKFSNIFTLGTIIYIILSIALAILTKDTYFSGWDEFSHWGANLKAMVANDLLWANNKWDGIHVVYQPLAGIIEYWFCKLNGQFSESVAYLAVDIAILTLLLPMLKNLKYNIKDIFKGIIFIIITFLLIYLFKFSMTSIYIDLLLGIMFAMGMYFATHMENKEDKLIFMLLTLAMAELKTTGLLFDGIMLIVVFFQKVVFETIKNKKITKDVLKNFGKILLVLVTILIAYISWNAYCKSNDRVLDRRHDNNFVSEINIKEFIKGVLQYKCDNEKILTISRKFYDALNSMSITTGTFATTCLQLLCVIDIIIALMYIKNKNLYEKEKILSSAIAFNIGFVLYSLLLMGTFMYAFTEAEGRSLASFDRYMATFFIAWVFNILGFIMSDKNEESKNHTIALVLIMMFAILFNSNLNKLIHPINKNVTGSTQYIREKAQIVNSKLNKGDKVYVIFQDPGSSLDPFAFRYYISPIVMNLMDEYSLGKLDSEDDHLTYNITEKEWEEKLIKENYGYVYILRSDEEFEESYKEAFDEKIDMKNIEDKIFKVNIKENNKVILTLYE